MFFGNTKLRNYATTYLSLRSVYPNYTCKERHESTNIILFQCNIRHFTRRPTYSCLQHKFAIKALLCNTQDFYVVDSDL